MCIRDRARSRTGLPDLRQKLRRRKTDFGKTEIKTSEKQRSRLRIIEGQDLGKTEGNKTEYSDTDWSKERIHTEKRIREPALQKGKLTIETEVL